MQAGSTKALISKDISSQKKYSSSTLVFHTLYFCIVQFKAALQRSSLQLRGKLCQQSITCGRPKTRFCLCSKRDRNANATGSKAPLQGKQPLCKAHHVSSGSVLYKPRSLLPHRSEHGHRKQRLPAEHRAYAYPLQPNFTFDLPLTHSQL